MALKNISDNKIKIYNPYGLYVKPFVNENTVGSDVYFLDEVIRDTTTITQDDPTDNKIENEFGSAPILNNVQLGSYQFSAEVADMQAELLEKLCGYVAEDGKVYAPSVYTPVYAEIALVFKLSDTQYVAAVLPKVQLNSKATFDSLSTSMGRITLAGTGLNLSVNGKTTPFYLDTNYIRENELSLEAATVTNASFNVKATVKGGATASAYEWYVDGAKHTDTDTELNYTGASASTPYDVKVRAKFADDSYSDFAYIVVTTKATAS